MVLLFVMIVFEDVLVVLCCFVVCVFGLELRRFLVKGWFVKRFWS